jgi:hypothetical protein
MSIIDVDVAAGTFADSNADRRLIQSRRPKLEGTVSS